MTNFKLLNKKFIYNTKGLHDWSRMYACGPVVDIINDKIWRIYYSTRDSFNHSRPSYIEVEAGNPTNILYEHDEYILGLGKIGTFDDCGISVLSILNFNNKKYMYYLGWSLRNTISYHNSLGLAISVDGGKTFKKFSEGPILSPTYKEPYGNGASYTLYEDEKKIFRFYYTSVNNWEIYNGHPEPIYDIKYAESENGIDLHREQIISVGLKNNKEGGIARPSVIKENNNLYRMWYSYRGAQDFRTNKQNSYHIGYAESTDGIIFKRMDEIIEQSVFNEDWENIMQAYPYVIKYNNLYWIFYNGNYFGKEGFGYAIYEDKDFKSLS